MSRARGYPLSTLSVADIMFRPTALRSLPRSLRSCNVFVARPAWRSVTFKAQLSSQISRVNTSKPLSLAVRKPIMTSLIRYQSTINKAEDEYSKRKLEADPGTVSPGSSVRHVTYEVGAEDSEADVDMMAGIKADFVSSHRSLQPVRHHADIFGLSENHYRHILTQGCPKRSSLRWHGWCPAIPCYVPLNRVLGVRHSACSKHWFRLASLWRNCGDAPSYHRTYSAGLRCLGKLKQELIIQGQVSLTVSRSFHF